MYLKSAGFIESPIENNDDIINKKLVLKLQTKSQAKWVQLIKYCKSK